MTALLADDLFAPVPGFPGYFVSGDGRVLSMKRPNTFRGPGKPARRMLSIRRHPRWGYCRVDLFVPGRKREKKTVRVAQLVAWSWIGPQPDGLLVCHRNGINTDDRVENLYYGTPSENLLDRHFHERNPGQIRPKPDAEDRTSYADDSDLPAGLLEAGFDASLGF